MTEKKKPFEDFLEACKEAKRQGKRLSYGEWQSTQSLAALGKIKPEGYHLLMQCKDCKHFIFNQKIPARSRCAVKPYKSTPQGKLTDQILYKSRSMPACATYFDHV